MHKAHKHKYERVRVNERPSERELSRFSNYVKWV